MPSLGLQGTIKIIKRTQFNGFNCYPFYECTEHTLDSNHVERRVAPDREHFYVFGCRDSTSQSYSLRCQNLDGPCHEDYM